jgi:hypothetical protein
MPEASAVTGREQWVRSLVVRCAEPPMRRQQFDLRMVGYGAFDPVQHLDRMSGIRRHNRHADRCPPVQLEMADLSGAHLKPPTQFRDDGSYHRALLLERTHVAEQKVEFDPADPHALRMPRGCTGGRARDAAGGIRRKR